MAENAEGVPVNIDAENPAQLDPATVISSGTDAQSGKGIIGKLFGLFRGKKPDEASTEQPLGGASPDDMAMGGQGVAMTPGQEQGGKFLTPDEAVPQPTPLVDTASTAADLQAPPPTNVSDIGGVSPEPGAGASSTEDKQAA